MSLNVTYTPGRALLRRLSPKQGGGTRNENGGFERPRFDRRLDSLPVVDRTSLGIRPTGSVLW